MQFTTRCSHRRGFTALELIIVLVIGFSIIAVSASKMGELFSSSKITRATSSIMEIATSIRSLRGPDGYGKVADITKLLKDNGLVPKTLRVTDTSIKNEWDGEVTAKVANSKVEIELTYASVPKKACAKLATAILESGVFTNLKINKTKLLTPNSDTQDKLTACTPEGDKKDLDFTLIIGDE